ncbi:hypothetical protein AMS68_001332 [Peltaster fructicola]|uniref:Phosphotransferase n=1 Tax=Peltaster fructicola TaxID=286661 RepID=A0A6H0XMF7_9PEZI|nr:hypothetical protein AMS68_001332 [Peltaster fructicola]
MHSSARRDSKRDVMGGIELPLQLQHELDELKDIFRVDTAKLKQIVDRFEEELYLGLARISRCLLPSLEDGGGSLPMNVTYIQDWPTGKEHGDFLTLDLGSTAVLRVCHVTLSENKEQTKVDRISYEIPAEFKVGSVEPLIAFLVDSIEDFLSKRRLPAALPLGFTFSFPVTQEEIDHGVLQTWTKGFDVKGAEGHDVADLLRREINERGLPVKLVALLNDTTGAMMASRYRDPQTVIGAIFGTGCNAAYMEHCADIPKISGMPSGQLMAINCEYGAFDNEHLVLPRTKYDIELDEDSPRPGEQAFEKMSAGESPELSLMQLMQSGLYLGELFRRVMLDLIERDVLFHGQDTTALLRPYIFNTVWLSAIENDTSPQMQNSLKAFQTISITPSEHELAMLRHLAQAIAIRGARLCCCGVAAICKKKGITSGHVAADGSVANKHSHFKKRWAEALGEVLDWPANRTEDPIIITAAEDGTGIGAAVISAMAPQWPRQKERRASRQRPSIGGAEV